MTRRSAGVRSHCSLIQAAAVATARSTESDAVFQYRRGPLPARRSFSEGGHPAWLTSLRSHFAARSTRSRALHDQRVIAAFDDVQRGERQRGDERAHFIRRAERIARAVQEEHRRRDVRQMRVAPLRGLVRRMQGIAEKDRARRAADRNRCCAATCDAIRPPIDLPPA